MKNVIRFVIVIGLLCIPSAALSWGMVSVSFGGGHYSRSVSYSRTVIVSRPIIRHRTVIINDSPYYNREIMYRSGRSNHIHRQAGRRYVNDFPNRPVVVVPSRVVYYGCDIETYY